ncbi:MAG: hypothetical protein V4694_07430 [Pseudomonadota bacterium]
MYRIILLIILVLIAIPFFNKAKDYAKSKSHEVKTISETAEKMFRYKKDK